MKRREMLKGALIGLGAWKTGAAQIKIGGRLAPGPGHEPPQPLGWKPLLFDEHQARTVEALAEHIIPATDTPGAKEAGVAEYIDLILNDGPPEPRNSFLEGLGWLDGLAIRKSRAPFVRCAANEQTALLREIEESPFFRQVKELVIEGYYTSETGIDELNRGGVPDSYGCPHGEH